MDSPEGRLAALADWLACMVWATVGAAGMVVWPAAAQAAGVAAAGACPADDVMTGLVTRLAADVWLAAGDIWLTAAEVVAALWPVAARSAAAWLAAAAVLAACA